MPPIDAFITAGVVVGFAIGIVARVKRVGPLRLAARGLGYLSAGWLAVKWTVPWVGRELGRQWYWAKREVGL